MLTPHHRWDLYPFTSIPYLTKPLVKVYKGTMGSDTFQNSMFLWRMNEIIKNSYYIGPNLKKEQ